MTKEEQHKTLLMGAFAEERPDRVSDLKKRVKELEEEFIKTFESYDCDELKAIELVAFTLFVADIEKTMEKIK